MGLLLAIAEAPKRGVVNPTSTGWRPVPRAGKTVVTVIEWSALDRRALTSSAASFASRSVRRPAPPSC